MTDVTIDRGSDFRVGNVLSRAWEIFGPNFLMFFCITLVVALPKFLYLTSNPQTPAHIALFFGAIFIGLLLNTIGMAVILFAAFQQLRGRSVRIGEALQRALARFFPLVGLGILMSLGIMLGLILLLVPGVIWSVMWTVAVPVCVVEALGPTESMSRSSQLTKGYRWPIFGIALLLGFVNLVTTVLVGFALASFGVVVQAVGTVIWTAVWTAYWNCTLIMIYHDLRVAKEGIDTRQIAAVFD